METLRRKLNSLNNHFTRVRGAINIISPSENLLSKTTFDLQVKRHSNGGPILCAGWEPDAWILKVLPEWVKF